MEPGFISLCAGRSPMTIEQPEPARRQLDDVHVLVPGVVIEHEADLVAVERDRRVDVADGQDDDFQGPVHAVSPRSCEGPSVPSG